MSKLEKNRVLPSYSHDKSCDDNYDNLLFINS